MDTPVLRLVLLTVAGWMNRRQQLVIAYLVAENRVLCEQLGGRRPKLTDAQRNRLARAGRALGRKALGGLATIASPDTILRWYGKPIANKYDGSAKRTPGRPRTTGELERLVIEFATDNPRWGYTRVQGALANLGMQIGRSTVRDILLRNGIDPAPERGSRTSWSTFLRAHWGALAATDFFSVEVLTLQGLVRYYVLFVIELKT